MSTYKWNFAIGTTSRVPGGNLHYFMADYDEKVIWIPPFIQQGFRYIVEPTHHGYHLYTDCHMPFAELVRILKTGPVDPSWIRIGERRGYFFLAHKQPIKFSWPVEYMYLFAKKKGKTRNASRSRLSL